MLSRSVFLTLAALCLLGKPLSAQLVTFTDHSAFLAAVGSTSVESFEGLAASPRSTNPINTALFTVTPDPGLIGILDGPAGGNGAFATDGTKFLLSYRENLPAGTLHFVLTAPTTAFGLFIIDNAEIDGLVSLHTNVGEAASEVTALQAPPILSNGNVAFFGFTQSTPFTDVFLTSTGIDDSYGIDQVTVAAVPEPSTLIFGLAGVAPVLWMRRRQTA
jgi:hypothetical protein